ncbi:TVP38/TMEM64 family protein [Candidatus Enterococcus clewellii]|uniref:TVP38/TMEM64 family membrane protein n=1 Tax=Candidatus Enterococcus clewellii TaxID=1834193 RepID=A0A242K8I7_9ENTE|nr:VTT domain-containing protein [Enterococcus sp. 9E7_DIV0242]OTP17485.1 hypothetical protein A5888_001623 [Enterococcus sp. 9E7_DIV0242]
MTRLQKFIRLLPFLGLLVLFGLVLYGLHLGIFKSPMLLKNFIHQFGQWAIIVFILLQIVQVIIPILPGGISSVAGMLMFGNIYGLLYSYIGLVIGEILAFMLVRHYGKGFVKALLSPKKYGEFTDLVRSNDDKKIQKLLVWTLIIPFAPDDIVCLVAGMTDLPFKKFLRIILLLKPWSIGVYSYFMVYLFEHHLF